MKNLPRVTPEETGIRSETLIRLIEHLNRLDSLNSIMIVHGGKVCLEGWWQPYSPQQPHMMFSLSKSFTAVAIGIAAAEKRLGISDRLTDFFPEYRECVVDDQMRQITLHHLLSMTSGHATCAKGAMESDREQDYVRGFLSSRLAHPPGERFAYNSAASYMLAAIIRKITGRNVREYLLPRLFTPLGIVPGIWECDPRGTNLGGWGLYLTTEDIAKFANLLLHHGRFDGKQLIPADFLTEATRKQSDNSMNEAPDWKLGYGYQFWRSRHGFRGDGASGQYALVIPEKNLAIAVTSCIGNMQDILTIFWNDLVPQVGESPLPADPAAHRRLLDALSGLSMRTAPGDRQRREADRGYEFEANRAGIHSCSIEFGAEECALTFHTDRGPEQLRAGFGSHRISVLQLTDAMPHPTAASAAWTTDDILEIHTFCVDGTFRDLYRVDFRDDRQPLTRTSRCSTFRPSWPELRLKSPNITAV